MQCSQIIKLIFLLKDVHYIVRTMEYYDISITILFFNCLYCLNMWIYESLKFT